MKRTELQQPGANVSRPPKVDTNPVSAPSGVPGRAAKDSRLDVNKTVDFSQAKSTNPTNRPAPPVYNPLPPHLRSPSHFNTQSFEGKKQFPLRNFILIGAGGFLLFIIALALFFVRVHENRKRLFHPPARASAPEMNTPSAAFLPEDKATVTDEQTVITTKIPLISSAKFSLSNISGNVTIEGTDEMSATVTVIKKGGTPAERKDLKIGYSTVGGNLALKSPQIIPQNIDLSYEVKLPRSLGQVHIDVVSSKVKIADVDALIEVKSVSGAMDLAKLKGALNASTQSGDISLSQANGDIAITSTSGSIVLTDVSGATIKTENISGDTRAVIGSAATSADALSFESVSGDIDIKFKSDVNAELDASTVSGAIDVEGLGVPVKKSPGSISAAGRVGIGGQPLEIKTTSGNIKVTKK